MNKHFIQGSVLSALLFLMSITAVIGKTADEWYTVLDQLARRVVVHAKKEGGRACYMHPFRNLHDKPLILTEEEAEVASTQEGAKPETPPVPKPPTEDLSEEDRPEDEVALVKDISEFTEGADFDTFITNSSNRDALTHLITSSPGYTFNAHVIRQSYTLTDDDLENFVKIYLVTKKHPNSSYYYTSNDPSIIYTPINKMTMVRGDYTGKKVILLLNLPQIQRLIGTPCADATAQSEKKIASYGLRDFVIRAVKKLQEKDPSKRTLDKAEQARLQQIVTELKAVFTYADPSTFSKFKNLFTDSNAGLELHNDIQQEATALSLREYYLGLGNQSDKKSFNFLMKYFTKEVTKKQCGEKPTEAYLQALVEYELVRNIFPSSILSVANPEDTSRLKFTQTYKKDLANDKKETLPLKLQVARLMHVQSLSAQVLGEMSARPWLTTASVASAISITAFMAYAAKRGAATKLGTLGWLYYIIKSKTSGLSEKDLQFYARKIAPEKIFDTFKEEEAFKISQIQETLLDEERHHTKKPLLKKKKP